jgi:hypothetical protein
MPSARHARKNLLGGCRNFGQGYSTATILKALVRQLAQLEDPSKADMHDTVRDLAGLAMGELCRRYRAQGFAPVTKKGPGSCDAGPEAGISTTRMRRL